MAKQPTCPACGYQQFEVKMWMEQRRLDLLECLGHGCGHWWQRFELLMKDRTPSWTCRCGADFMGHSWLDIKEWQRLHKPLCLGSRKAVRQFLLKEFGIVAQPKFKEMSEEEFNRLMGVVEPVSQGELGIVGDSSVVNNSPQVSPLSPDRESALSLQKGGIVENPSRGESMGSVDTPWRQGGVLHALILGEGFDDNGKHS